MVKGILLSLSPLHQHAIYQPTRLARASTFFHFSFCAANALPVTVKAGFYNVEEKATEDGQTDQIDDADWMVQSGGNFIF